jgi:hypothetical protein
MLSQAYTKSHGLISRFGHTAKLNSKPSDGRHATMTAKY